MSQWQLNIYIVHFILEIFFESGHQWQIVIFIFQMEDTSHSIQYKKVFAMV